MLKGNETTTNNNRMVRAFGGVWMAKRHMPMAYNLLRKHGGKTGNELKAIAATVC